jgi:hypothetical protein
VKGLLRCTFVVVLDAAHRAALLRFPAAPATGNNTEIQLVIITATPPECLDASGDSPKQIEKTRQ